MSIYMKIPDIEGEVTSKGYEKCIGLNAAEFSINRSIKTNVGWVNDRLNGTAAATEMLISKDLDIASPKLFLETCVGANAKDPIEIAFCNDTNQPYLSYVLHNVLFSGYYLNTDEVDIAEYLTLNFTALESRYIGYDNKNNPTTPISAYNDIPSYRPINLSTSLHYHLVTPFMKLILLTGRVNLLAYMGGSAKFNDHFDSNKITNISKSSVIKTGAMGVLSYAAKAFGDHVGGSLILLKVLKQWRYRIQNLMPKQGGVLIGVIYDIGRGDAGLQLNLRGIYPAGSGQDYKKLIEIDNHKSFITPTPLSGDTRTKFYVWVTK